MHIHRASAKIHGSGLLPFAGLEIAVDGDLDVPLRQSRGTTVLELDAELTLRIATPSAFPPASFPPARASQGRWLLNSTDGHVQIRGVRIPIAREQIESIESWRTGDVDCEVAVRGRLLKITKGGNADVEIQEIYEQVHLKVPQSVWVKEILERVGFATYEMLEMRLDTIAAHPELSRAASHLRDGLGAFHNGRVQEPIGDVRQAMEAIETVLKDHGQLDEYAKRILAKGRSAAARPQHDNATDPEPTRADAEMALHIGRATLRWATSKLTQDP
jgi:hypothetical protein